MAEPAVEDPALLPLPAAEDDADSLIDQIKDLAADTRNAFEAEVAWQGVRASFIAGRLPSIVFWAAIALACLIVALFALGFGAILVLAPLIGALLATLAVTGALLLVALIAWLVARRRVRRLKAAAFAAIPPAVRP